MEMGERGKNSETKRVESLRSAQIKETKKVIVLPYPKMSDCLFVC